MSVSVKAFVQSGVQGALVWDPEDVYTLRVQFRVVGGLVGALPVQPRQSGQLGVPLLLTADEVTLLLEEGTGVLDLRQYAAPRPSLAELSTYAELRRGNVQKQLEVYQEKRMQQLSDKQSVEASSSFTPHTHTLTADPRLHSDHTHFPTAHWMYPHTVTEKRCLAVYRDLWARGFTLTSGLKYGADYLVYQGDPALVHSHYIALVLPWQQPIKSLASLCRVGSKVVKAILLCSVEGEVVQYQTLQWASVT